MIQKDTLMAAIIAHFQHEYDVLAQAARASYEAATHEENKAENKYDTRGLEASYLAESQSKRANELQQTVNIYKAMPMVSFSDDDIIAMGALIQLEDAQGSVFFFLGPREGGTQVTLDDFHFRILSGASPLGKSLLGKEVGDEVKSGDRTFEITRVR